MEQVLRRPMAYMPELDGLRAVAILSVLPVHFIHGEWQSYFDSGVLGVRLFFVLSGFLIGSILLGYRERITSGGSTLPATLRTFYFRRFLRLSPPYLIYLAGAFVMFPGERGYLPWFILYLQNILFAIEPEVFSRYLAHFWTLAIEEQFYLIAPFVLLRVAQTRIVPLMIGLVVASPVFRAAMLAFGFTPHQAGMLVPGEMDTLCIGVLLAAYRHYGPAQAKRLERFGLRIGLPLTVAVLVMRPFPALASVQFVLENSALSLLFVWLIGAASTGLPGRVGALLRAAPIMYLGRISYGIYVYHFNVPGLLRMRLFPALGWQWPSATLLSFSLCVVGSVVVAAVSYRVIEMPVMRLKDRFRP